MLYDNKSRPISRLGCEFRIGGIIMICNCILAGTDACKTCNNFKIDKITYMGIGNDRKWQRIETRGGKLAENATQAIARDILCHSISLLNGTKIVAHVHDEVIIEAPDTLSLEYVTQTMAQTPEWADGLPLKADGYETKFYKKD